MHSSISKRTQALVSMSQWLVSMYTLASGAQQCLDGTASQPHGEAAIETLLLATQLHAAVRFLVLVVDLSRMARPSIEALLLATQQNCLPLPCYWLPLLGTPTETRVIIIRRNRKHAACAVQSGSKVGA